MKIEMGESLFYSWLRHVKECHVVQTNWKVSPQWEMYNEEKAKNLMSSVDKYFSEKYGYKIFKQNASLSQIIQQAECDAIGISIKNGKYDIYAVDVAFHEAGLNYGSKETTVMKIIAKTVRTAMCLLLYMDCTNAEIIFASPKINPAILNDIYPCMEELNNLFINEKLAFNGRLIANDDFNTHVLQPILLISGNVADTSELFMRAYQMCNLFAEKTDSTDIKPKDTYNELKIGKLVKIIFRKMLEEEKIPKEEIVNLQSAEYCKNTFNLNFPALVKKEKHTEHVRYYVKPIMVAENEYYLCSQWFESNRPFLNKWIESQQK